MILMFVFSVIIFVPVVAFCIKTAIYLNIVKQLVEKGEKTAGAIGFIVGLVIIAVSFILYYLVRKVYVFVITLIGIVTIINSIKYMKYH